jgi:hypothetical protein
LQQALRFEQLLECIIPHNRHAIKVAFVAGVSLVEEVTAQKQEVYPLLLRVVYHFLKNLKGVLPPHYVVLLVAQVYA